MPTLSKDGQIRMPEDLCRRHGWELGQKLDIVDMGDFIFIRRAGENGGPPTQLNLGTTPSSSTEALR